MLMIAFRMAVEGVQAAFLPAGDPENYEALSVAVRVALPVAGGLLIGALFQALPPSAREVGPAHVLDCLERTEARLPLRNALVQLAGGALSIISGHSVGREGPAIHLGAATASIAGQALGAPPAVLRTLAACGVAAAIAASFNTPLAGVVFAMEAVVMEYTVAGFAPVILAAVTATALNRVVYGGAVAFAMPPVAVSSLWELPYVVCVGVVVGALSAVFIALLRTFALRAAHLPFWLSATLGGSVVGVCAIVSPEVMGIGYDTVDAALVGKLSVAALATVAVAKILATTAGVGLGLPGGVIGPMLVTGAAAGGALGIAGGWIAPQLASSSGFYALIGMGAMMAGTLHAPLAALTAMLELTGNPNIIWPGMLATIGAFGVSRVIFRQESVFVTLLRARRADGGNGARQSRKAR